MAPRMMGGPPGPPIIIGAICKSSFRLLSFFENFVLKSFVVSRMSEFSPLGFALFGAKYAIGERLRAGVACLFRNTCVFEGFDLQAVKSVVSTF